MEVYDNEGNKVNDISYVFKKWQNEYQSLYNPNVNDADFDDEFYHRCTNELNSSDLPDIPNIAENQLNSQITRDEIQKSLKRAKNKKAVGIDSIPNEILKNENTASLLTILFSKIFDKGIMPSCWNIAVIKPIPKSSLLDYRIPLQYRGISLLSTIYKIFTFVLNSRLMTFVESNKIFKDEQNGFRKSRSCAEHIFTLSSIIRNRKAAKKPTFTGFIDFEKAFDRVDRKLLLFKLRKYGINGNFLNILDMIYSGAKAGVELNGQVTDWFDIGIGVRQGDPLSPTLFGLFINDLVDYVKDHSRGLVYPEFDIQCLLFADDLVLISDNESDLQKMFDAVSDWCRKWRMKVNVSKSKVVHFRGKSDLETEF